MLIFRYSPHVTQIFLYSLIYLVKSYYISGKKPDAREMEFPQDLKFSSKVFEILEKLPNDFLAKLNEGSSKEYSDVKRDIVSKQPLFPSHESSFKDSSQSNNFNLFANSNSTTGHALLTNQRLPSNGQIFPISQSSSQWEDDSLPVKRYFILLQTFDVFCTLVFE